MAETDAAGRSARNQPASRVLPLVADQRGSVRGLASILAAASAGVEWAATVRRPSQMLGGKRVTTAVPAGGGELRWSGPQTIPDLLRESARRFGPKLAVQARESRGEWRRLTFRELLDSAVGFAAGLIALGFAPREKAAIILENGLDWGIAYYGILIAGGVVVPIYYDLSSDEIEYVLRESESQFAVVSGRVLARLPAPSRLEQLELPISANVEWQPQPLHIRGRPSPPSTTKPTTWRRSFTPPEPPATPRG
jgi:non-ribosomal peptide synthetase component F